VQQADKFMIRLPEGMRDRIRQNAEANRRTMNAEIIHYIDLGLDRMEKMATAGASLATEPAVAGNNNHQETIDVRTER
jgi:hypothetical protein